MHKTLRLLSLALILVSTVARADTPPPKTRFASSGPHELRQLVVPGFEQLPLDRKLFIYWLSEAVDAGRDIAWLQLSENGFAIRQLFEKILEKREKLTEAERAAIESYYFLLIANSGVYDATTNSKNVIKDLTQEAFVKMLARLQIGTRDVQKLLPDLFDAKHKPLRIADAGTDLIADSGVNFYGPGVTNEKLEALPPEQRLHPLSYPVLAPDGTIRLEYFRINGKYGEQLARVDKLLAEAALYAHPEEIRLIEQYRKTMRTGDPKDALKADRIWVTNPTRDLTFMFGFVESYDDPKQARPTWEAFILLHSQDPEAKAVSDRVRALAPQYELDMPVDEEFKKKENFTPPLSEAANMIRMSSGSPFLGVNLPNDNAIREKYGSKSFTVHNRVNALGEPPKSEYEADELNAFYLSQYHDQLRTYGRIRPHMLQVEFHEILGHGSGRDRDGVSSNTAFGDLFSGFEESRAELASLYHMTDYKTLLRNRLVPDGWTESQAKEFSEVVLVSFFTKQMLSYHNLKGRTVIRQAHQLGRQIILNHLLNEGALKIDMSKTGVPRVQLTAIETIRESLGRLWYRQQRIKSTGDLPALQKMMDELSIMTPQQIEWAKAITKANVELKRPEKTVVMNPFMNLVKDTSGKVVDVELEYLNPNLGMDALHVQELRKKQKSETRMCHAFKGVKLPFYQP